MSARLVYLKLELKRACKKLPHIYAGAIVLLLLVGTIALLAGKMLYGEKAVGRIAVGVVLPEGDLVAGKAVSMLSTLDSVKSICDFTYMEAGEALDQLKEGKLFAVMEVPERFVQDIINGTNTPVQILLPKEAGLESRIFKELTDAGGTIVGASQAGIYAGDELCRIHGLVSSIPQVEEELNRIYLGYSLPRADYFRNVRVSATGDVDTLTFYGISGVLLFLLLSVVPVSSYLSPLESAMKQKLLIVGVGPGMVATARILGLGFLMAMVALPVGAVALAAGWISWSLPGMLLFVEVCLAAAAFVTALYQIAGTLMGGVMLLFLVVSVMHFLAGGFLPLVFLPASFQAAAPFLPTSILMEGIKNIVIPEGIPLTAVRLIVLIVAGFLISVRAEVVRT